MLRRESHITWPQRLWHSLCEACPSNTPTTTRRPQVQSFIKFKGLNPRSRPLTESVKRQSIASGWRFPQVITRWLHCHFEHECDHSVNEHDNGLWSSTWAGHYSKREWRGDRVTGYQSILIVSPRVISFISLMFYNIVSCNIDIIVNTHFTVNQISCDLLLCIIVNPRKWEMGAFSLQFEMQPHILLINMGLCLSFFS